MTTMRCIRGWYRTFRGQAQIFRSQAHTNGPQFEQFETRIPCLTHSEAGLIHSRMLASVSFPNVILHPDAVNPANKVVTRTLVSGERGIQLVLKMPVAIVALKSECLFVRFKNFQLSLFARW